MLVLRDYASKANRNKERLGVDGLLLNFAAQGDEHGWREYWGRIGLMPAAKGAAVNSKLL
jgi:hypothetical protein